MFPKLKPPVGQGVDDAARVAQTSLDHSAGLQAAQTVCQQVRCDPAERPDELVVAHRAGKELAHDQETPAIADCVERARKSTELSVGARCHVLDFLNLA